MASGCHEAGYRLAGAPLDHVCCRHLYGIDRTLTAWPGPDPVVILAVGPHDRSTADVYALLLNALAVEVPAEERTKPLGCDELGEPPPTPGSPRRWQRPCQPFGHGRVAAGRPPPSGACKRGASHCYIRFSDRCWPLVSFLDRHSPNAHIHR